MRLNNKGFAITAVLYGLLILFVILVSSYLLVLSAKKDWIDVLVDEIESEYKGEEEIENLSPINLKEYITNLYNNAEKTIVTNNGIVYNYAPTVRLMNDRFGSNDVDADGGNIRYYGADDTDLKNYIYFNCSNYSNQSDSTCEKWRIIGIVDGKVKIIRNESLGQYAWDYTSTGEYDNNWSDATLNTLLNNAYYNSKSTTYYERDAYAGKTGIIVNFATYGITEATRNNNLISESIWYTNGMSHVDIYASTSYTGERTGTSTWSGKIALAYPSDYGYSADLNSCRKTLYNYDDDSCVNVNWLTNVYNVMGAYKMSWLLTPFVFPSSAGVSYIDFDFVDINSGYDIYFSGNVLPVLYLNFELAIESEGDGSSTNPYRIHVK